MNVIYNGVPLDLNNMEIRIFRDMNFYSSNKPMYVSKVLNVDAFDFSKCLDVFRLIYGSDIIIVFLCV